MDKGGPMPLLGSVALGAVLVFKERGGRKARKSCSRAVLIRCRVCRDGCTMGLNAPGQQACRRG